MTSLSANVKIQQRLIGAHLNLRLAAVRRSLSEAAEARKQITAQLNRPDMTPMCVSNEQLDQMFQQVSCEQFNGSRLYDTHIELSSVEIAREAEMRFEAERLKFQLPLLALTESTSVSEDDLNCLLMCVLAEMHPAYARIYAFIQDDVRLTQPTLGLLCELSAQHTDQWFERRASLSSEGELLRLGFLHSDKNTCPEIRQQFSVAPSVFKCLSSPTLNWNHIFFDADEILINPGISSAKFEQAELLARVARALAKDRVNTIGVWGNAGAPLDDAVMAIAVDSDRPLRHWRTGQDLARAIRICDQTKAILWVKTDALHQDGDAQFENTLIAELQRTKVPVIFSGEYAWRPTELLQLRRYTELNIEPMSERLSQQHWQELVPELDHENAAGLAQCYRLSLSEQTAVVRSAQLDAEPKGRPEELLEKLKQASRIVSQKKASRFSTPLIPRREAKDLILPESVHQQVLEIPRFYRALDKVNQAWGFKQSGQGIKALFTGDSGTGKTLAAEVIAKEIGLPLMRLDVSQLVSKWLGETEKNIDAAFREAECSHAMLFFDEADTLFGKRGEIQSGNDRYANLEVGFLLQRLEQFSGLAVLASNLKDEIDSAFVRRFQVLLNFPRPGADERLKLWHKAFPANAPLDPRVNLSSLVDLDLTGAGIMSAAQTAALIAADQGTELISVEHIISGISRQFHRESRVLGPEQLELMRPAAGVFEPHIAVASRPTSGW